MTVRAMDASQQQYFARLAQAVAHDRSQQAFAELFDYFAPRINAYLRRLGMQHGEAEDLAQEVMAVLWHKAHLFDSQKSSLATWLFRVARNRRIDHARRDKSGKLDPDDPILHPEPPAAPDAELDVVARDDAVHTAMKALPEEQFELVRMAFFLGLSHSQISEETGLPLGTVKSRIRLAFGRMRQALEQDMSVDTDF